VVRCGVSPYSSDFNECANYNASKGQISPPGSVTQVTATPPAMTAEQMARFKTEAQTATPPTYFTSCPPSLAGAVVYIDLPSNSSGCSFTRNLAYNSEAAPGLVIMPKGTLSLDGGLEYYGVIYLANCSACSPAVTNSGTVLNVGGNAEIHGGVLIDGEGGMSIGNSGNSGSNDPNIIYSPNAFNELATFGTAGLVQNTWQELSPGD
jgi:hypothetical protein